MINMECYLCGDESESSYFLRLNIDDLAEVCPECHHFFVYADKDLLEKYKERRNIKL